MKTRGTLSLIMAAAMRMRKALTPGRFKHRMRRCIRIAVQSATVNQSGVVKLSGTVYCTAADGNSHWDSIILTQQQGPDVITGYDEIGVDCVEPSPSFAVTMDAEQGNFCPGEATVGGHILTDRGVYDVCPTTICLVQAP